MTDCTSVIDVMVLIAVSQVTRSVSLAELQQPPLESEEAHQQGVAPLPTTHAPNRHHPTPPPPSTTPLSRHTSQYCTVLYSSSQ
jgi:hypothetical protein